MNKVDFTNYLPKYLSSESTRDLLGKLSQFPSNINDRFYTHKLNSEKNIFQGDGLLKLPFFNWDNNNITEKPGIILSNTCDVDGKNSRLFPSSVSYAPIASLEKYEVVLRKQQIEGDKISQHLADIKAQRITQIFYLPKISKLGYEGIVFLDKLMSMPATKYDLKQIETERLFTLSNYGFYLFLFKMSVHFMRMQEKVDRDEGTIL